MLARDANFLPGRSWAALESSFFAVVDAGLLIAGGGGAFAIMTGGVGRAFGTGANSIAGIGAVTLDLRFKAFKAAVLGARERSFFTEECTARLFRLVLLGFLSVTGCRYL